MEEREYEQQWKAVPILVNKERSTWKIVTAQLSNLFYNQHFANPASLECNETRICLLGLTLSLQILVKTYTERYRTPVIFAAAYAIWSTTWLFSLIFPRAAATTKRVGETFSSALRHST